MMDSIIQNLFSTQDGVVWLAVKWAVIVLVAGFIGQFGKAFASHLIGRARLRKPGSPQNPPGMALKEDASPRAALQQELPPGQAEKIPAPAQSATEPAVMLKNDKKQMKALAKQQKKLSKKLFK
jgi:hypothetical protein